MGQQQKSSALVKNSNSPLVVQNKLRSRLRRNRSTKLISGNENDAQSPTPIGNNYSSPLNFESTIMSPKAYDDGLFIEPAGDYDVIYGEEKTTDGTVGKRPYLRLTSGLPNMTNKLAGSEVRMRCEAMGQPSPIQFSWLKNFAPVEKNRRTRIKNREMSSRLVIMELDPLDSGYYQCTASNAAGSVNSTGVLKVNLPDVPTVKQPYVVTNSGRSEKLSPKTSRDDFDTYDYMPEVMNIRHQTDGPNPENFLNVPNTAAGPGWRPLRDGTKNGRWLDGQSLKKGQCVPYHGDACYQYLAGQSVKLVSDRPDDAYDAERDVLAAMLFVQKMPHVSEQCKRYSHQIACTHMFKVCDQQFTSMETRPIITLCKSDCEKLKDEICQNEYSMAQHHDMVGDGPKALLPDCKLLNNTTRCLNVLEVEKTSYSRFNKQPSLTAHEEISSAHWCFVDNGLEYRGIIAKTKLNKSCNDWPQTTSVEFNTVTHPELRDAKNYCRNPSYYSNFQEPWCYTNGPMGDLLKQPCDVPRCPSHKPAAESDLTIFKHFLNNWNSISPQWQLIFGMSSFALIFLLALICCLYCCRRRYKRNSKAYNGSQITGNASENASSKASYNLKRQALIQSCNGSTVTNTNNDMNKAYIRMNRGDMNVNNLLKHTDEVLNPLLPQYQVSTLDPKQQQHFYEMKTQNVCFNRPQITEKNCFETGLGIEAISTATNPYNQIRHPPFCPSSLILQSHSQYNSSHTPTDPSTEPYHLPTIHEQQLKLDKVIGEDLFSTLYIGEWIGGMISGATIQVAIRAIRPNVPHFTLDQFRDEISTIGVFNHANIIKLIGASYLGQTDLAAVYDFMVHGDLVEFLKVREPLGFENDEKERIRNADDFLKISAQIVTGMEYLVVQQQYIHRDLSARNCFVGDHQIIKIGDFARMKTVYDRDYYKINSNVRIPLRWIPKEVLNEAKYSHASDVYAFGVTLWEIYTYAKRPFGDASDADVVKMIQEETPLDIPEFCPPVIYGVMLECYKPVPAKRPTFEELKHRFQKWCSSTQSQALQMHQHRASSVHSNGSNSTACTEKRIAQVGILSKNHLVKANALKEINHLGPIGDETPQTVPSPAPNVTIPGSFNCLNKLARISNNHSLSTGTGITFIGNGFVHSTPLKEKPLPSRNTRLPVVKNNPDKEISEEESYSSSDGNY